MRLRTVSYRSWLVLAAIAAALVLLAGLVAAGTHQGGPGTSLGSGTVKPKPPPR